MRVSGLVVRLGVVVLAGPSLSMKSAATFVTLVLFIVFVLGSTWYLWKDESDPIKSDEN